VSAKKKHRSRPAGEPSGLSRVGLADLTPSLALTDLEPLDELASVIGGTFVVVVEVPGGRIRRRCFLTAAAAEKAAARALVAGLSAKVYLAELKPLWLLRAAEVTE